MSSQLVNQAIPSTIVEIPPALTASYPNQNIFPQTGSNVPLTLRPMNNQAAVATVDSGNPIKWVKINAKGGYKKYTDTSNTEYCYNNFTQRTRDRLQTLADLPISITGAW